MAQPEAAFNETESFAERLVRLMGEQGKDQVAVAFHSGLSYAAIGHYMSGRRRPGEEALQRLARGLGVDFNTLMGYQVNPKKAEGDPKRSPTSPRSSESSENDSSPYMSYLVQNPPRAA